MPLESYRQVPQTLLGSHALTVITELPQVSENMIVLKLARGSNACLNELIQQKISLNSVKGSYKI
jgi:hypothetical protein